MISDDSSASGMAVLELLLAITMLMVFTGVVVAVMEVTLRFMGGNVLSMSVVFVVAMMTILRMWPMVF